MKLIYLLLACLVFLPLVNAEQQYLGEFYPYDRVDFVQGCSNCTYVRLNSVVRPYDVLTYGANFTKYGTAYNYTWVSPSYPMQTGHYIVYGDGDLNGLVIAYVFDFDVVDDPTGLLSTDNTTRDMIYLILFFLMIVFLLAVRAFMWGGVCLLILGAIILFSGGNVVIGMVFCILGVLIGIKGGKPQ